MSFAYGRNGERGDFILGQHREADITQAGPDHLLRPGVTSPMAGQSLHFDNPFQTGPQRQNKAGSHSRQIGPGGPVLPVPLPVGQVIIPAAITLIFLGLDQFPGPFADREDAQARGHLQSLVRRGTDHVQSPFIHREAIAPHSRDRVDKDRHVAFMSQFRQLTHRISDPGASFVGHHGNPGDIGMLP